MRTPIWTPIKATITSTTPQLTLAAGVLNDTFGWFMLSLVSALAVSGLGSVTDDASFMVTSTSLLYAGTRSLPPFYTADTNFSIYF